MKGEKGDRSIYSVKINLSRFRSVDDWKKWSIVRWEIWDPNPDMAALVDVDNRGQTTISRRIEMNRARS